MGREHEDPDRPKVPPEATPGGPDGSGVGRIALLGSSDHGTDLLGVRHWCPPDCPPDPARCQEPFPRAGWGSSYAGGTTHYDTFGLTPSSTHEEVRQAYIDRALRYHPDRQEGEGVGALAEAERRMQEANAAWAVLGNREVRAAYDAEIGVVPDEPVGEPAGWDPMAAVAPVGVRTTLRRFAPLLIVLALLAAVFLFTAYAGPAPS